MAKVYTAEITAVKDNEARIEYAESKITPTAIVQSVNEALANGDVVSTTSLTIEKEKVTIHNGDLIVEDANGVDAMYVDKDTGDLTLKGKVYATDGEFTGTVNAIDGSFTGEVNATSGTFNGSVYADDGAFNGTIDATALYAYYGNIGGWDIQNNFLEGSCLYGSTTYLSFMQIPTSSTSWVYSTQYSNDGGTSRYGSFYVLANGETHTKSLYVDGDLSVYGTNNAKYRVIQTENYGCRTLGAYETPKPMFADIGESIIDETGVCYVDIDDIFYECIDTSHKYYVTITKYGEGDLWVQERQPSYFIVKGTPNLNFCWRIEAVQIGCNTNRFEEKDFPSTADTSVETETDYIALADEYLSSYEEEILL